MIGNIFGAYVVSAGWAAIVGAVIAVFCHMFGRG